MNTSIKPVTCISGYMSNAFSRTKLFACADNTIPFEQMYLCDTFIGTGLSGALAIPNLAHHFGKHWAIVRKDNDNSHGAFRVEGTIGSRWMFVDDLISSGSTLYKVIKTLNNHVISHNLRATERIRYPDLYTIEERRHINTQMVGIFEYDYGRYRTPDDFINTKGFEYYRPDLQEVFFRMVKRDNKLPIFDL